MRLDWGADERRFAGDHEAIRERLGEVARNLTATRRTIASDATEAGDWYAAAGQYDAALDEFDEAREAFEAALATARDCYPDAVEHLQTELDAVEDRIKRARTELTADDREERRPSDEPRPDQGTTDGTTAHTAGESSQSAVEK
ncbi:hypothetical protein ACFQL1_15400 [Halomicroarcula sp. GCM10025709]